MSIKQASLFAITFSLTILVRNKLKKKKIITIRVNFTPVYRDRRSRTGDSSLSQTLGLTAALGSRY